MLKKNLVWIIIGVIVLIVGMVAGFFTKFSDVEKLSNQVNMKNGKANIHWMYNYRNNCDGTCRGSPNSSSSWGGGTFGK